MVDSKQGPDRAKRRPATLLSTLLLGGSWAHVGPIFVILSHFFAFWGLFGRILRHLGFLEFSRFFVDFGWISGRFWDGFSMVFRIFAKNRDFVKIVVVP